MPATRTPIDDGLPRTPSRALMSVLLGLILCVPCRAAERWTPDDGACNERPTTYDIADCLAARTKVWDQRLNQAYQALLAMLQHDSNAQRRIDALKAAERAWLQYRIAQCNFYETEDGTIRIIEVASCMRDMTQARAIGLQQDGPQ